MAGICRTDIYVAQGQIASANPVVLGHEFSGTVVKCGDEVSHVTSGDHVTANPILACRHCRTHDAEGECFAPKFLGVHEHGVFAEYVCLPAANLYQLPKGLDARAAAYAEPVAATLAILKEDIKPDQRGLIYGTSRLSDRLRQSRWNRAKNSPQFRPKD